MFITSIWHSAKPSIAGLQKPPESVKTLVIPLSLRALAFGADYTMIGRPVMYAMGADGKKGLRRIVEIIKEEVSTTLGLVGLNDINDVTSKIVIENTINKVTY